MIILSNLLCKKEQENDDKEKSPEFVFDPKLNPFIFKGKIISPSVNTAVDASKPIYIMYMYNSLKTAEKSYKVAVSLNNEDGNTIPLFLFEASPEKDFPGGWKRMVVEIPANALSGYGEKFTFNVEIKDETGTVIEKQERTIFIK